MPKTVKTPAKSSRAKKPEGSSSLTLLGGGPLPKLAAPSARVLETFVSPASRDYEVMFFTGEFTSHCPVTGQPDYAEITIRYTPDRRCIESKSLKHYLGAYRNEAVFAEGIVNRILDDVVSVIAPRRAVVTGEFAPRGGIGIRVEATHSANQPKQVQRGGKRQRARR